MRRSVLAPLLAGALALSVTAPAAAEEAMPIGGVNVVIGGVAFGDFTYPVEAGKRVTVQRHVLDPGEILTWKGPSTVVAMHGNEDGLLQNYPNCNSVQNWRPYPAYYVARSKDAGTLRGVTHNPSSVAIEFSGEEGVELFRAIRKLDSDLPVLLMTAWASIEMVVALVKEGAADLVRALAAQERDGR